MTLDGHKGINSFLEAASNNNVHGITCSSLTPAGSYRISCDKCLGSYEWVANDYTKPFGIDLDVIGDWCEGHKHKELESNIVEFPKPLEPYMPGWYDNYYNKVPVFGGKPVSSDSWYTKPSSTSVATYKASALQIDQMVMKKVWQWSGFNVDLQANNYNGVVSKLRALCKCGESIPLMPYKVINNDPLTWDDIKTFCEAHRFCGVDYKEPKGRKFKHA